MYARLPPELLIAIGKFATCWAQIEQELILTTSALAAQDTDGWPLEHLRLDFKRLRQRWYQLSVAKLGKKDHKRLTPLNMRLANASRVRGYMLHGIWHAETQTEYLVHWFEQKGGNLQEFELHTSLGDVRHSTDALEVLCNDLELFTTGA